MRQPEHFFFYSDVIKGDSLELSAEETGHLVSVLRAKEGETFQVTDGKGAVYTCTLTESGRHGSTAKINSTARFKPILPRVSVYMGIPERDELEWAIEALVPLGVGEIIPVVCTRCQKKWWTTSWEKHALRLSRKAVAALKQSLNTVMPAISEPVAFTQAITSASGSKIHADMNGKPLFEELPAMQNAASVSCFIGPPGGFTDEESAQLAGMGSVPVRLSPNRLRTELAAVVMCAMLTAR